MNSAVCANNIWGILLDQRLKTRTATKHCWCAISTDANDMFPFDTMSIKEPVHFVEYFLCSRSGAGSFAKQKFIFQVAYHIHIVHRCKVVLNWRHSLFHQAGSQRSETTNSES